MQIVLATRNPDKVKEIRNLLAPFSIRVLSLSRFPGAPEVREDGATLEANAIKKAHTIARFTRMWAIADDTGLEVDALGGRPGVRSARFAGPKAGYAENCEKLLRAMKEVPAKNRGATFRCVAAIASPERVIQIIQGRIRGRISLEAKGRGGFGYDPLFWVPARRKTFSELGLAVKNKISHRARAFRKAGQFLAKTSTEKSR